MADTTLEILIKAKNTASKVITKLNDDFKKASEAANKLGNARVDRLNNGLRTTSERVKSTSTSLRQLVTRISTLARTKITALSNQFTQLRNRMREAGAQSQQLATRMRTVGQGIRSAGVAAAAFGVAMALPIVGAIKQFVNFEKTMARVKAVTSGITENEFKEMTEVAKELGATTEFTAQQAAEGLIFLSQAGLTATESMAALPGVLQLATAGGFELAEAADLATNVLASFGLGVEELSRVNDVLAFTASNANTSVSELGNGVKVVGAIATASGEELEDMAAVLASLANVGIKGAEGGTAVRNMLLRLQNPTKRARVALEELGVATTDAEGKFRGLRPILADLGEANLDAAQSAQVFGLFTAGAGVSASRATTQINSLREAIRNNADGFAASVQAILLDTLSGDIDIFNSAVAGVAITLGEALAPTIRSIVQSITSVIDGFNKWAQANPVLSKTLGLVVTAISAILVIGGTLAIAIGAITSAMGVLAGVGATALLPALGAIVGGILAIVGAFGVLKPLFEAILDFFKDSSIVDFANYLGNAIFRIDEFTKATKELAEAEAALDKIKQDLLDTIKKQEAAGSRDVEIASAELLASLSKKEIDALQDQLLGKLKLLEAEKQLAAIQGQAPKLIEAMQNGINEVTDDIKQTVEAEKNFNREAEKAARLLRAEEEAAFRASLVLQKTAKDAQALADAQREASNVRFDQNVEQLERVRTAQLAVLEVEQDLPAITEVFKSHYITVAFLAEQNANELKQIAKQEQAQLLAIESDGLEAGAQKTAEFARYEAELARATNEKILQIERDKFSKIDTLRNESFNRLKSLTQQSIGLAKQISDAELSGEQRIRELRRQGLTDIQSYNDKKKEIAELTSKFNQALASGDFELAKQLANRQISLSGQLVGEIKKGEQVQLSKEASVQAAIGGTEQAQRRLVEALKAEKQVVDDAKNAEKELFESLTQTLNKLDITLRKLAGEKIEFESTFKAPETSQVQREVKRVVDEISASPETAIAISTLPNEESLNTTKSTITGFFSQEEIDVLVRAASDPDSFFKALDEVEAALAGTGVDVELIPVETKFNIVKARILEEALVKDVEFTAETAEVEAAIEQLRTPTESTHTMILDNLSLKDDIADVTRDTESKHKIVADVIDAITAINDITTDTSSQHRIVPDTASVENAISVIVRPTTSPHTVNANTSSAQNAINSLRRTTYSTHIVKVIEQRAVGGLIGAVRRASSAIPKFAEGTARAIQGNVRGAGSGTSDSILAKLSNGEFVIKAQAVKRYGQSLFQGLNSMRFNKNNLPAFAGGGGVGIPNLPAAVPVSNQNGATTTLNLSFNGGRNSTLTGSRDSVGLIVNALQDIQRGVAGG